MFSAESWSKPARFSDASGKGLTPPPRVEKAFAKPSRSKGSHARARKRPSPSSQRKPARAASSLSVSAVIVSIGIDIIEIRRVREVLARTPRFRERVFTAAERAYCDSRGEASAAQHYAARFAAKEAA